MLSYHGVCPSLLPSSQLGLHRLAIHRSIWLPSSSSSMTERDDAAAAATETANGGGLQRTASLLVLLQLGSRIVTFSLNQALLAYTTPSAFGTATIQLEPLLNTVLFLCREGIRSALARSPSSSTSSAAASPSSISLIPLGLGLPLALAAFWLYAHSVGSDVASQPFFTHACAAYAAATVLELAAEPYFNRAQVDGRVKLRVGIEGVAVVARAVVTLLVVLHGRERTALLAFGLGQLTYAAALLLQYAWHYRGSLIHVLDKLCVISSGIAFASARWLARD